MSGTRAKQYSFRLSEPGLHQGRISVGRDPSSMPAQIAGRHVSPAPRGVECTLCRASSNSKKCPSSDGTWNAKGSLHKLRSGCSCFMFLRAFSRFAIYAALLRRRYQRHQSQPPQEPCRDCCSGSQTVGNKSPTEGNLYMCEGPKHNLRNGLTLQCV